MQRGFYWDSPDHNKIVKKETKEEASFLTFGNRRNFSKSQISLAASSITNQQGPQSVLTRKQLEQCGIAYINNGIVRTVIDKTVYFIHG